MTKSELRKIYKKKRLDLEDPDQASLDIANQSLKLDIWDRQYFHLFLPIQQQREVDTSYLLHILQGRDKSVVLSRSDFKTTSLNHVLLEDNTKISVNAMGIPEPEGGIPFPIDQLEVIFVPLLAYDQKGNRLGYGKGFYDRFLAQCNKGVLFVGLSYFGPEEVIPTDPVDIPLHYCITPEGIHQFPQSN
ncbi:5-formyltetrahydrofolate cyclo-ligase [Aureitalea marina]|uniref:5-formyltetrahydrofolate cyclo-ligase n=1 Tax=Aureitalea marina TaxID=930804 RepID=A0A2S7KSK4_9FLAO|nr:5-formyltetrahydrofolate cyclo-ligase [Aureitalea marina]PQB05604.1 5-formyltetrahydrofolate cyclo-ligase [Aureitalea marina]